MVVSAEVSRACNLQACLREAPEALQLVPMHGTLRMRMHYVTGVWQCIHESLCVCLWRLCPRVDRAL